MSVSKAHRKAYNKRYYAAHREATLAKYKRYRLAHPERVKRTHRQNYLRHQEARLAYRRTYFEADPQRVRASLKVYRQKLKKVVVAAYGGKCSCCGEDRIEFLTVEHQHHDGTAHRKRVGAGAGMYRDLIKRGFPQDGLTLFCWNCQMATRYGDECPHTRQTGSPVE
jgi:predicted restriction endonuclease